MFGNGIQKSCIKKKRLGMEYRKVGMLGMLGKVCMETLGNEKKVLEISF